MWKLPDGRDWLWGNLDLVLKGGTKEESLRGSGVALIVNKRVQNAIFRYNLKNDGISAELFKILKDVLHSICQKIWKTQQWP